MHSVTDLMPAESVDDMYRSLLSAWKQPEEMLACAHAARTPGGDSSPMFDEGERASLLDRMMLADQTTYLPDDLLAKIDRASMAVSLEVRAPLLDHRIVEFSWRLPQSLKLRGTTGKWILRQVLYRRVPKSIVDRPKKGFSVLFDRWLRGPLKEWAADLLSADDLRRGGLLGPAPIARAWGDLLDVRRQTGVSLWAVVMFQAWAREWQS
jgi:asparagine synthase (glutamine-hydrolysing)